MGDVDGCDINRSIVKQQQQQQQHGSTAATRAVYRLVPATSPQF